MADEFLTNEQKMQRIDEICSHVWMVRTFLKHCEEAEEDEELCEVHRDLYDFMLALGPAIEENDADKYIKLAKKKLKRLKRAQELFEEIQPEISEHMNFKMANASLKHSCGLIVQFIETESAPTATGENPNANL